MALKDVIKEARVKQNLKQDDAAEMVGVTVQTYSKWENGKTEPKASQVSKLAEILGLSEKEICSGKRNKRYDIETFLDYTEAARKNNNPSMKEAVMLCRFLSDHDSYFEALKSVYEKEGNAHQKVIDIAENT
jgi:DNA-binding XRE family transcriptional regulator